jgi:hypothetical protein
VSLNLTCSWRCPLPEVAGPLAWHAFAISVSSQYNSRCCREQEQQGFAAPCELSWQLNMAYSGTHTYWHCGQLHGHVPYLITARVETCRVQLPCNGASTSRIEASRAHECRPTTHVGTSSARWEACSDCKHAHAQRAAHKVVLSIKQPRQLFTPQCGGLAYAAVWRVWHSCSRLSAIIMTHAAAYTRDQLRFSVCMEMYCIVLYWLQASTIVLRCIACETCHASAPNPKVTSGAGARPGAG